MSLAPGTRIGPYEIVVLLGTGGMGEVYKARDTRLHRLVALKVLPPGIAGYLNARRFLREARTASALNHPNICTIYDVGQLSDGGLPFIAMELLEGQTLQDRLQHGRLPMGEVLDIGIALADALEAAHRQNIIHRDIKPSNVMLTARGPKLLDFGLAKEIEDGDALDASARLLLTLPGTTVGTVLYMAPEQVRGEPLDGRADLFSLGIVLYEMATGHRPFYGTTSGAVAAAILGETPSAPRVLRPELPAALDATLLKALQKDREARYQTAADLSRDLDRVRQAVSPAVSSRWTVPPAVLRFAIPILAIVVSSLIFLLLNPLFRSLHDAAPAETTLAELLVKQLTFSGNARQPAISPDGKYVAYIQQRGNDFSLWIRQVDTQSNVQIVPADADAGRIVAVTISPDGNFVDFVRGPTPLQTTLWRVALLGGPITRVVDNIASAVGWSTAGDRLAFVREEMALGTFALVVARPDGSQPHEILTRKLPARFITLAQGFAARPAWSPDDSRIAVAGYDRDSRAFQIGMVDVVERSERIVEMKSGTVSGLAWMDAHSLVVNSGNQVWRFMYPDGKQSRLTNDVNSYSGVSLSRDGDSVVTEREERSVSVWLGDAAATKFDEVVPAARARVNFDVIWAGPRLLYSTFDSDSRGLAVLGATHAETLTNARESAASADGSVTVFVAFGARERGLWRRDTNGALTLVVADPSAQQPTLTPDGKHVVFVSDRNGAPSLWIMAIDGGEPSPLFNDFATQPQISPDARRIMFGSQSPERQAIVVVCDFPSGGNRLTLPALGGVWKWTPDGRAIALRDPTRRNLVVQPLDRSAARQLTKFTDREIDNFAFSADGTRLAVARVTVARDIVLLRGLRGSDK